MAKKVKPIPAGYHSVTPYLVVDGAAKAIDFYKKVFGAKELMRMPNPDGSRIGHAELKIGDSPIMLADEHPGMNIRGPHAIGGTPVSFFPSNASRFASMESSDQIASEVASVIGRQPRNSWV